MFKDYFKEISNHMVSHALHTREIENLLDDGYNESLSAVLDSVEKKTVATTSSLKTSPHEDIHTKTLDNEYANKKYNTICSSLENYKKQDSQKTPTNQMIKQQESMDRPFKKSSHRRKLEFGCRRMSPVNFKLASIYEYMFDSNFEDAHSAEADCLTMLRCVTQIVNFFLTWSDNNASPLALCKRTK